MSPVLRLESVSFSYRDSVPLFVDASCAFARGWTALVAPNGAGKTTLLRLIAGELVPESGRVTLSPKSARVVWCRQRAEERPAEVDAFAWDPDRSARRWRGRLGLDPGELERWPSLSPGSSRTCCSSTNRPTTSTATSGAGSWMH